MIRGIDASMKCTPFINNLRALEVNFIGRYYTDLQKTRNPEKVLTPREAHDLSTAGFDIVAVWELMATPGYFTAQQGLYDGVCAYRYANEAIQQPENTAIYFAVDFDATAAQYQQLIAPYFQGINEGFTQISGGQPIYLVGVYGSGAVCASLRQQSLVRFAWLAQSSGWQGFQSFAGWDIRQGPSISHPPFEFDQDLANGPCGAFRLTFLDGSESFTQSAQS